MRAYTPREYQRIAIDFMVDTPRCSLMAKPGMGKTSATLAALDAIYLAGETHPTLIVAPKRVAKQWPGETQKWLDFSGYEFSTILGTEDQRVAALRRDVPFYSTNYEQLPWLIERFGDRWPFRIVVADEASKLKNTRLSVRVSKTGKRYLQQEDGGSKRAGLFAQKVAFKHVKRFIELTGSPAPNGMADLYGQIFYLDPYLLGTSYGAFEARWFERVMRHPRDKYGELRLKAGAEAEINAKIAHLCLALDPKDWFPDLQEPLMYTIPVQLPAKARKLYEQMEKEMYIVVENEGVEAFTAAAMMMKCRQLAAGAVYLDPDGQEGDPWAETHDEKLQALEDIYEECGGTPLLVAYQFKSDLARLKKAFPKGVDLSTDAGLAAFKRGEAPMGFGHPGSIGHGIDGLQDVTHIIVFFSADFNLEYREQIIERVGPVRQLQSGHNRKVLIYDIVAEDTIDEVVLQRLLNKCSVQEAVFTAMKKKRLY